MSTGLVRLSSVALILFWSSVVIDAANLITKKEFVAAITSISSSYPVPSDEQYNNVIRRATPAGKIATKRELAMFMANIIYASKGLTQKREPNLENFTYPGPLNVKGKQYYGRGYINLAWAFNYLAASKALYGTDILLKNPDLVETNDTVAWDVSFWYWAANVHTKPGVATGQFGATVAAIDAVHECGPDKTKPTAAHDRFVIYVKVFKAFNLPGTPNDAGCS